GPGRGDDRRPGARHGPGGRGHVRRRRAVDFRRGDPGPSRVRQGARARGRRARVAGGGGPDRDRAPPSGRRGGVRAGQGAGRPIETGPTRLADEVDDVVQKPYERGRAAMEAYLRWEEALDHEGRSPNTLLPGSPAPRWA